MNNSSESPGLDMASITAVTLTEFAFTVDYIEANKLQQLVFD
ncbi:uncharacterized protein METZ01_LOCUS63539 [marine metagenome]|uniref:Uncharacterized protein n=1 Tax=marine metagenome TaxID=408172 RepID=A0A381T3A5_9ZZZZ|tara:strand:+ start:947 stop:1072 length:126 start_codon:yes stop_codon:yes gene_type:complete